MIYTIEQNKNPDKYRAYAKREPMCACDMPHDASVATLRELEEREEELAGELAAALDVTKLALDIQTDREVMTLAHPNNKNVGNMVEHDMLSNREFICGGLTRQIAPLRDAIDYLRDCVGRDATPVSRLNIPFFDFSGDARKFERFFRDSSVVEYQE